MFTSAKVVSGGKMKKPGVPRDHGAVTILTSGCHFSGKLHCRGSSRIGAKIEGQLISEGLLIIEEDAVITAEVKAEEVVIQGTLRGKLIASGRVELAASSRVEGDISTPILIIREGAQFNGRASMAPTGTAIAEIGRAAPKVVLGQKGPKAESALGVGPLIERDARIDLSPNKGPDVHVPTR